MKGNLIQQEKYALNVVRAAFVLNGTSLAAWCRENGVVRRTAEQAINGSNRSDNARLLAERIHRAAQGTR